MTSGEVKLTSMQIHFGQFERSEISNRSEFPM